MRILLFLLMALCLYYYKYDSWILWLGHIILFILKEDLKLSESRHHTAFLWELHSYYLPTARSRCLICLSNLLRPDKSEPKMKLDSTWDFLSHFWTPLLKTIFPRICIRQTALKDIDSVSSTEKNEVCLQTWKKRKKKRKYCLPWEYAGIVTVRYKRFRIPKFKVPLL